jgi:hypothetical protein
MMGIRMPQNSRTLKSALAILFAAFGISFVIASSAAVLAVAGSTAVLAADGDDDDELWDVKMVRKFLRGFGLRNGQEAGIEYKERPPLVLPPSSSLPAPAAATAPAANNPAWPSDPDEKRLAAERQARKDKTRTRVLDRMDGGSAGDPLKPSELEAGRTDKTVVRTGQSGMDKSPEMTPSDLGWSNSMWNSMVGLSKSFTGEKVVETREFVREPSRNTLTDPPAGYRTPSPAQPYGINSKPDRDATRKKDHQTSVTQ